MTAAKPSNLPQQSIITNGGGSAIAETSENIRAAIETLNNDLKAKISKVHAEIMGLRTSNDAKLDILLYFSSYNDLLLLHAECADTLVEREILLHINRTVGDLLGYKPDETDQKISGLLKLLQYVIRLESGTLVPKEQVATEIDSIDEQYRKKMLADLMPGFVLPFQMPLQSNPPNIRETIDKLVADTENGIVSKVLSRGKQNLQRTELALIGPAEWILFYKMNTDALVAFEQKFYVCVEDILTEIEKDEKYDVKNRIDTFMEPYLRVEAWKWSKAEEVV